MSNPSFLTARDEIAFCRFDNSSLLFEEAYPFQGKCPQCPAYYIFRTNLSTVELNYYYFEYKNEYKKYILAFYLADKRIGDPNSHFSLFENDVILKLNYLPNVNPDNVEAWLQRINNLKVFL